MFYFGVGTICSFMMSMNHTNNQMYGLRATIPKFKDRLVRDILMASGLGKGLFKQHKHRKI